MTEPRPLHIFDHSIPLHSGYTFRSREILRHQRELGWDTQHITSPKQGKSPGPSEEIDGLLFHRSGELSGPLAKLPLLDQYAVVHQLGQRLEQVARATRPNLLHAHSPSLNGIAALKIGKKLGLPVIYEVRAFWEDAAVDHGTCREGSARYRLTRRLETWVLHRADAVTTICEGLRNAIINERQVPADKVSVIPNAVNISRFQSGNETDPELAARLGLWTNGHRSPVVGFIGSFYAYEGLDLLIKALPRLLQREPDTKLLLVGGGFQDNALRQLSASLGLQDRILFTGRVPHEQVNRYYDLIDILAYPRHSMRLTELVTPLKPLEAMASGRLIVASDIGGHRELIRDRDTGYLFPAGNADALADTLAELLTARELWSTLRKNGRNYVEHERNWSNSIQRYQAIYQSVLKNP